MGPGAPAPLGAPTGGPGAAVGARPRTATFATDRRRTLAAPAVTPPGLHRTGVRRYYASKEELLLELAERGWDQWRDAVGAQAGGRTGLGPTQVAAVVSGTLVALPVFCDLLTHVALHLEGDVDIERARRYKTNAFAAHDEIATTLDGASTMTADQINGLLAVAITLAAGFWQVSHPTLTLAKLYEQVPCWGHVALDFAPRLESALTAYAIGAGGPEPRS